MSDADPEAPDTAASRFYQGTIVRLSAGSRAGVVHSRNGRDIPFTFADIRLLGADGFGALREGMRVGFDLGWTSRGVRVTVLKIL